MQIFDSNRISFGGTNAVSGVEIIMGLANFRVSDKENRERVRKWWDKLLGGLPQKCRTAHRLLCTPFGSAGWVIRANAAE